MQPRLLVRPLKNNEREKFCVVLLVASRQSDSCLPTTDNVGVIFSTRNLMLQVENFMLFNLKE